MAVEQLTPEEIARDILRWAYEQDRNFGSTLDVEWIDRIAFALRSYGEAQAAAQKERDAVLAESFIPSGFRDNPATGTYHRLPLGDIIGIARDDRARVIAAAIRAQP